MASQKRWIRLAVVLAGVLASLWIGYLLRAVLNPLLLAALFAYILNPTVTWMENRGIARFRAILALYGAGTTLAALAFLYVVPPLYRETARSADRFQNYIESQPRSVEKIFEKFQERLREIPHYDDAAKLLALFLDEPKRREDFQDRLTRALSWFGERATAPLKSAFAFLSYLFLVPLYTFYFLQRIPALYKAIPPLFPPALRAQTLQILGHIDAAMAGFIFGRSLVCILKGLVIAAGLWFLDIPYAFVLGALAGVLSLLPAASLFGVGGIAALLACADDAQTGTLLGVGVVFVLSEVIEGVLSPVILGRTASLHPVMIVFAILAFGKLLGLFGLLLAVPLASATKILWTDLVRPYVTTTWEETPNTKNQTSNKRQ